MVVHHVQDRFATVNAGRAEAGLPLLDVPSARTVCRRIKALDPFEVIAQREGVDAARRKFGFYEEGIAADYPMQRVEIDEWMIDIASLLGESGALDHLPPEARSRFEVGRRWIVVVIDCATRCVVGFRIVQSPNAADAIRTLQLCTEDKTPLAEAAGCQSRWDQYGGIGILTSDQGSAFSSEIFRTAVIDIGSVYEAPPAGVPKLRARIERLFRTFAQQLAPMLIGRTFGNSVERGDYPSEKWAALTDDELAQIFTLFIVDIYHNTPHAGLKGETPANAWKRLAAEQGVTPPPDANTRRVVFGVPHSRQLDRHGLRVFGINYTSPSLQKALLRGLSGKVELRVDPEDITHISVCLGHEWISAKAVPQSVWGLSFEDWKTITRDLRKRFKAEAVLTEDIIRDSRRQIVSVDAGARRRLRHLSRLIPGGLRRLESDLFLGLRIGPDGSAASGDLDAPSPSNSNGLLSDVIKPPSPDENGSPNESDPVEPDDRDNGADDEDWTYNV